MSNSVDFYKRIFLHVAAARIIVSCSDKTSQLTFFEDVVQLQKNFEEYGNPFLDNISDLRPFGTNTLANKKQKKLSTR